MLKPRLTAGFFLPGAGSLTTLGSGGTGLNPTGSGGTSPSGADRDEEMSRSRRHAPGLVVPLRNLTTRGWAVCACAVRL